LQASSQKWHKQHIIIYQRTNIQNKNLLPELCNANIIQKSLVDQYGTADYQSQFQNSISFCTVTYHTVIQSYHVIP